MPSVKKVEQKTVQLIGEAEGIAALEILLSEIELVRFVNNNFRFRLSHKTVNLRRYFLAIYKHKCVETLNDILAWSAYIFTEARKYSVTEIYTATEIYSKYAERVSLIDRQPTKVPVPLNPYLLQYQTDLHKNDSDIELDFSPIYFESVWVFEGFRYEVKRIYSDEEARLLILEDFDKERQKFERLKEKFDETPANEAANEHERIPEKVRIEVWRRDGGKCARCGSRERLEYDHIVPRSKGGSNTARNVELLCEKHNRSKSNNIV